MRSRLYTIISIAAFAILYCFTAIIVFLILIFVTFKIKKPVSLISRFWAKSVFILIAKKINITGRNNINSDSRYILVANHSSLFDILAIMSFYPGISWFGHERLLKVPLFGQILKMTDYIPFKEPTFRNTRHMMEQLVFNAGSQTVAIFPEGTRTLDGKINAFYKGFIYLFRTSDIGILPVTLNGFYQLKPKNRLYINFSSKLSIVIHKPLTREELIGKTDSEIIDTVKKVIESAYQ
jgi:1-acyl-sn-glycerol-3-phosphate acyltransferase